MYFFRYEIVNTPKNRKNNNNKSVGYYKGADATPRRPITETAQKHKECN
jgi:hypothetical protein